jgi:hypothetical protein
MGYWRQQARFSAGPLRVMTVACNSLRKSTRFSSVDWRAMLAHLETAPTTSPVTLKNGARKLLKTKQKKWCGEGDLNPHEIAPASTSR